MSETRQALSECPTLEHLLSEQLQVSPSHEKLLTRRFTGLDEDDLARAEYLAELISRLIGGRERSFCEDYAWLCDEQVAEELQFRRNKRYRLTTMEEAVDQVYSNKDYMARYMNGLLMTQLWWSNHTQAISYYREKFVSQNALGHSHLEIGPGHGLLLFMALNSGRAGAVESWDISPASIDATQKALTALGIAKMPKMVLQDMFANPTGEFDSIVFSEVLEHMEKPGHAVDVLRNLLSSNGRLFINMPINSPAPDHLFNLATPEQVLEFISERGLAIEDHAFFPATNYSLEDARRKKLSINCAVIARRS